MKAAKDSRPQREREKSSWKGKKSEEKEQKKSFGEEIVDAPFESDIILLLKNWKTSYQKFYMMMLLSMNDELSSISSQVVEQVEAIPEVVLSEVSKLINSVISKR